MEHEGDHHARILSGSELIDQPLAPRMEFWRRTGDSAGTAPQDEGRNDGCDRTRWVLCVPGEASEPARAGARDPTRFAITPWQVWVGTHISEHGPGLSEAAGSSPVDGETQGDHRPGEAHRSPDRRPPRHRP